MGSLVDGILLVALVATSACVVPMYLKLKRLDRTQAEYGAAVAASGVALTQAGEAVRSFKEEGREVLEALSLKIEEARAALDALEASRAALLTNSEQSRQVSTASTSNES